MSKKKTWKKPKIKDITSEVPLDELMVEDYDGNLITIDEMFGEKGVDYAQGGIVKTKKKKKKMKKPRGVGAALKGYGRVSR